MLYLEIRGEMFSCLILKNVGIVKAVFVLFVSVLLFCGRKLSLPRDILEIIVMMIIIAIMIIFANVWIGILIF